MRRNWPIIVGAGVLAGAAVGASPATSSASATVRRSAPALPVAAGAGRPISGNAVGAGISRDGRFVLFSTPASTVAGDGRIQQVYVRDTVTGTDSLISRTAAGTPGNRAAVGLAMSSDGRYVVYRSAATDVPGSGSGTGTGTLLYRYDRMSGRTLVISRSGGAPVRAESFSARTSTTGRFVAYSPTGPTRDVYLYDARTDRSTLVDRSRSGGPADGVSYVDSVSTDGHVTYASTATNIDPQPGPGTSPTGGQSNIYLWDPASGTSTLVTRSAGGGAVAGGSSGDGRYVVFRSRAADLVAGRSGLYARDRIFSYNVATKAINRIPTPLDADGAADFSPTSSADGRYIAYTSTIGPETGTPRYRLARYDRVSRVTRVLVDAPSSGPLVSGDGRHVL
jgi:Tol biopolymer transport system component